MHNELSTAVYTIPMSEVRENCPDTREPYDGIIAMGRPGDIDNNLLVSPAISRKIVTLPEKQVYNFAHYYEQFYTGNEQARITSNCARFACAISGVEVTDIGEAFVYLDTIIKPENVWDENRLLPLGAIGVLGTLEYPADESLRYFRSRVTHAFVGTGTELVLQVTALGGRIGLRNAAEMIGHMRDEIVLDGFSPNELLVFTG